DAGFAEAEVKAASKSEWVRHFDYRPTGNWLRFGNVGYLVLLLYGKGGVTPAFKLEAGTWLFDQCTDQFEEMWVDALNYQPRSEKNPFAGEKDPAPGATGTQSQQ